MDILKRLLALLLGVTVLPLRVLAYNLMCAMTVLFIGIAAAIGIPIMLATIFHNLGIPKAINFLLSALIIFPLVTAITVVALTFGAVILVIDTICHMLRSAWLGCKNGLLHGMDGFWSTLATQNTLADRAHLRVRAFFAGVEVEELIYDTDFDGFQRVVGELQDVIVIHEDLEVPDLQSKGPRETTVLLDANEAQQMEQLIKAMETSEEPLALKIKEKVEALKILLTQYKDLARKLEEVRSALVSNDKSKINDELIAFNDVETPILLVKQYKKEKQWHNVPACSYVTDKESLLHWLKTNPKHPINKDLLKNPELYNQMETKYTWYELTANDCSSQELGEAAAQMRILSTDLVALQSEEQRTYLGEGASSQTFFSGFPSSNSSTTGEKRHTAFNFSI